MPKRVGEKIVFQSKLFTIKDIDLQFPHKKVTYQIMEKQDSCGVVPVQNDGKIIMIKEFVYAINSYVFDFPGGRMDKGYTPEETANKELEEEIGYRAKRLDKLAIFTLSPGYLTQKTHLYLGRDLVESKREGDEEERPEVHTFTFDEVEVMIEKGEITEARTIAGFFLAKKLLQKST